MRHSRRVRLLKRLIPVGAGFATLFILVVMIFDPFRSLPAGVGVASIGLNGSKIVMEAPHLRGFKRDSRPYEVLARAASQDLKTPNVIELQDLDARMSIGADGTARLRSPVGVLDNQREVLDLRESVRVTTDSGYDMRGRSARIEFKTGHVRSDEPVSVTMTDGTVEADTLEIIDNGAKIVFAGRVRSVLIPRDPAAPAQEAKP